MSVIYVDQTGQLGGGELSIFDWLEAKPAGASVVLFEDGPFRQMLEGIGVPVQVLKMTALKDVRREAGLRKVLSALPNLLQVRGELRDATKGGDVLYANSQKAFILTALCKRSGQPLLWHLRDILTAEHFSPLLRKVAVFMGNRYATRILVNSQATADAYVDQGGDGSKIRLVPDGVDARKFAQRDAAAVERLRESLCPCDVYVAGLFGRLAEWKGQSVLLEAAALIPDLHVCLVGDALFGEQAYAEQLRQRAAQQDLAGRVHFLGFRKDVPELMQAMDVVVHASTAAEPLGRVIIEGMLAGRPVIATRAGGAAEIVEDERSGLLTAPGSVAELTDALRRLRDSPQLAARLVDGGHQRALSVYSLDNMVRKTQAVLDEVDPTLRGNAKTR